MNHLETVRTFWKLFDERKYKETSKLLDTTFICFWPSTNELFTKEQFIKVNENYPGKWFTKLQKTYAIDGGMISITHVYSDETKESYYATSIFSFKEEKITSLEEYWSAIETPPKWRLEQRD